MIMLLLDVNCRHKNGTAIDIKTKSYDIVIILLNYIYLQIER